MRWSSGTRLSVQSRLRRVYSALFLWTPAQRLVGIRCTLRMPGFPKQLNSTLPANIQIWGSPFFLLGILPVPSCSFGHVIKSVSFLCVSASHHHRPSGVESPQPSLKFHMGLLLFGHLIKPVSFLLSVNASHHHCPMGMQVPPPSCKFHIRLCLFGHLIKPVLFLICVNVSRHQQAPQPSLKFHLRLSLFGPLIKPVRQELGVV